MIERNARTLQATEQVTLLRRNALRPAAPPSGAPAADILLMDPPYRSDLAAATRPESAAVPADGSRETAFP